MVNNVRVQFIGQPKSIQAIRVKPGVSPTEVAFYLAREIKANNPVDTGRSRRGWYIKGFKNGNQVVYNKVSYVQYLEQGHSDQAPNGYIAQAISRTRRWMNSLPSDELDIELPLTNKAVDRKLETSVLALRRQMEPQLTSISASASTKATLGSGNADELNDKISKLIVQLVNKARKENTASSILTAQIRKILKLFGIINDN